ncbi:hypothetical protein ZOSMA_201G00230 [Zostera marina]|uniref:Uncharacterized protein n=1 Tax=Zostera marina TaxID=29655 RepID=A0A0K9PP40_ZOSMR|nr:hypothetical protein ZOSMA_201G00230 [Zostera marina]
MMLNCNFSICMILYSLLSSNCFALLGANMFAMFVFLVLKVCNNQNMSIKLFMIIN